MVSCGEVLCDDPKVITNMLQLKKMISLSPGLVSRGWGGVMPVGGDSSALWKVRFGTPTQGAEGVTMWEVIQHQAGIICAF